MNPFLIVLGVILICMGIFVKSPRSSNSTEDMSEVIEEQTHIDPREGDRDPIIVRNRKQRNGLVVSERWSVVVKKGKADLILESVNHNYPNGFFK